MVLTVKQMHHIYIYINELVLINHMNLSEYATCSLRWTGE